MAKIEYSRLRVKRTDQTGVVPTVPASEDITTFIETDIFVGELFYNTADNILYTRDDNGIVILTGTGAPYLPLAGGTMDTNAVIDTDNSLVIENTTGSVNDKIILDPSGYTGYATGIMSDNTSNSDIGVIFVTPGQVNMGCGDGTNSADVQLYKNGKLVRVTTKYEQFDLYPNVISGSLMNMSREVTSGYTALTTDATPTNCGQIEVLSAANIYIVEVKVIGREVYNTDFYGATLKGIFSYNGPGTMTLIGTVDKFERSTFTTATCKLVTDGDDVFIEVTGEASTDIQWTTTIKTN